ncbi:MAG: amidohydrolase [Bacillota bacterium]|nr:amidohydrolase [Bacillota bacterium]
MERAKGRPVLVLQCAVFLFAGCILLIFIHSGFGSELKSEVSGAELLREHLFSTNLIAHACGEYHRIIYSNSLNALESNYKKGFRFFEIDFSLSSDKEIIMIHDWEKTAEMLLGTTGIEYTHKAFIESKTKDNLTLMDMDMLIKWLETHSDAYVVTDSKKDGLSIWEALSKKYDNIIQRFYIQACTFEEYYSIKKMGFKNIILTLYKTDYSDRDVLKFAGSNDLYAITMPAERAVGSLPAELKKLNVKVYAHTVNSINEYKKLLKNGVYGVYTDSIPPLINSR